MIFQVNFGIFENQNCILEKKNNEINIEILCILFFFLSISMFKQQSLWLWWHLCNRYFKFKFISM